MMMHLTARRAAIGIAKTSAIGLVGGTAALTVYTTTERGLGFQREVTFWGNVTPIIFDYWWNTFSSSPKVIAQRKFSSLLLDNSHDNTTDAKEEGNEEPIAQQQQEDDERKELINALHERNAPKIYNVMLTLGGLYIKLGQVLSVTALPIPEQYRVYFRKLQSNVPTSIDFDSVIKPTLEKELGVENINELFDSFDVEPVGAASIGQAHRAVLKTKNNDAETKNNDEEVGGGEEVIVKVQYPHAKWQIPADIECIGQFLQLCVWFGIVDESASKLSYDQFSRQFTAELDYERETYNLQCVHTSSLDPSAPYIKKGVVVPRVYEELCTKRVITMAYLPGPKFEQEAREQLALLGVDTTKNGGIRSIVKETQHHNNDTRGNVNNTNHSAMALSPESKASSTTISWKANLTRIVGNYLISVDSMLSIIRFGRRLLLWSTALTVKGIQTSALYLPKAVPSDWVEWADERQNAILQAERWNWTQEAVTALLDVHGYQILNQGLFNADPHPGNILVVQDENNPTQQPKIGLIDYGQVKILRPEERVRIAKLILSIANNESDEVVANHFRNMGIQTKNNSSRFLADFGRLMFGSFEAKHLDHAWHRELHKEDRVLYFPNELSMVYRTALLLRGLAMSLQFNPSVGEEWRHHAEETIKQYAVAQNE